MKAYNMKIKIDSKQFQLRKRSPLPSEIELNSEVSWMVGVWAGDNWSSKEGTVIRGGQKSSGRFGINNNDEDVIQRFLQGLKSQFKITKIKIDVQIPRNLIIDKENIKLEVSKKFGIEPENINVYRGSPWRRKIGFAVYTNNTALLRFVNKEIYKKLPEFIQNNSIDVGAFLQGIADSEGDVDKANKNIGFTNKDRYVASLIVMCLEKLGISFKKRIDERQRIIIEVTSLNEFNQKVGFWIKRKQQALQEMLCGNFVREKDKFYLKKFEEKLKEGITAKELSEIFGIAYPTVKMVLRNLFSNKLIERKKSGRNYVYYLP
jgi:phosphoenolpyruvate synthase/pyruvate phosphate dikinase